MKAVEVLAAGVRGAEHGHAEFYQRGTPTRATWYGSFEAGSSSTGDLTLDANGGGEAYVDGLTTVKVFGSDGTLVREIVAGTNAGSMETVGPSFTGAAYGTTAAGANKPVTGQAVLDRWITSGGAVDWNVLVGGAAKTLQAAIGAVSGIVYNVKASEYGALGDDATDDLTAIQAAIDAAKADGVGMVYMPPGDYLVSDAITLPTSVVLMGAGPDLTSIKTEHATANIIEIDDTTTGDSCTIVSGISFGATTANLGNAINWSSATDGRVLIHRCWFGASVDGGDDLHGVYVAVSSDRVATIEDCNFHMSFSTQRALSSSATNAFTVYNCRFSSNIVGYNNIIIDCPNANVIGCQFDTSNVTSDHTGVRIARGTIGFCRFEDPSSGTLTCIDLLTTSPSTGDTIREFSNVFGTDYAKTLPYGTGNSSRYDAFICDSRNNNWLEITDNSATITIPGRQFGKFLLNRTASGAQTVNTETTAAVSLGAELWLMLFNDNTSGNITFTWGSEFLTAASTEVLADNSKVVCVFVWDGALWVQANTFVQV